MDLEKLNNKQLREKFLEYGLPNVPITTVSRKLLLKRLDAAMNGTASKKPNTPKSRTPRNSHKTTVSPDDQGYRIIQTRRATKARRSLWNEPATLVAKAPARKPKATDATDERPRRQAVLTKSGVVTSSYIYVPSQAPLGLNNEKDVEENKQNIEMNVVENLETAKAYEHPTYNCYNEIIGHEVPALRQPSAPLNQLYQSFQSWQASHSSTPRQLRLDLQPQPISNALIHRLAISACSCDCSKGDTLHQELKYKSDYIPIQRKAANSLLKRHGAANEDPALTQYNKPYLDKFTGKLKNLRPEPLYKHSTQTKGYGYTLQNPNRRQVAFNDKEDHTLGQLWAKLEEEYHLKAGLYFVLVFIITAFIYVFFLE